MVVRCLKTQLPEPAARVWPTWPLCVALIVLFFGPLVAPLFQATHLPLLADSGALAHDLLAYYVCPTPAKSYVLLTFPMAVCARCWGATLGLWLAWLLVRATRDGAIRNSRKRKHPGIAHAKARRREDAEQLCIFASLNTDRAPALTRRSSFAIRRLRAYLATPWPLRMGLAGLAFLLWTIEINVWTTAPRAFLLLNGANAGFWAGLFVYSIWPGLRHAWADATG